MEALDIKKILTDTIAYCSKRYGTLPYTEQEPLQIVMDSAHSLGGGASGNISYMTEAVFTKESMSDPLRGANAAEVIAHEIVHQWWGMKRFVMDAEYQPWSAEALTSYTTYRIMKELHGEEYAQKYYIDIWNSTVQDINRNFYLRNQQYQELLPQNTFTTCRWRFWIGIFTAKLLYRCCKQNGLSAARAIWITSCQSCFKMAVRKCPRWLRGRIFWMRAICRKSSWI